MVLPMRRLLPYVLLGTLSMLFAEVFSGASTTWFISPWGLLLTFPLYLGHVLFFWWLAHRTKRCTLVHLYLFGMLFALYESWVTKVLWAGYFYQPGVGMGSFLGVGSGEYVMLVLFWHPVMSFILPILVYELLTGKALTSHHSLLTKKHWKSWLLLFFVLLLAPFIATGNAYEHLSANASLLGSFAILYLLHRFTKEKEVESVLLSKTWFIGVSAYIALLYILTFIFLLPERIPTTAMPFITILASYAFFILLLLKAPQKECTTKVLKKTYTVKDLVFLSIVLLLAVNLVSFSPTIGRYLLFGSYAIFMLVGIGLFFTLIHALFLKKQEC